MALAVIVGLVVYNNKNCNKMAKRKRIYSPVALKWQHNPFHELCKKVARDNNISYREASNLLILEQELAKIPAK